MIRIRSVNLKYTYKIKHDNNLQIETLVKLWYKPLCLENELILMYNNNIDGLQEKLDQCDHKQHPARSCNLNNITRCTECWMPIYE